MRAALGDARSRPLGYWSLNSTAAVQLNLFIVFDNVVPLGQPSLVGEAHDLVDLFAVCYCCAYDESLPRLLESCSKRRGDAARVP